MPEISVIVPVFKTEKFLARCIDSIIKQSFTDFECILIDDGSPDTCPAICDSYAKKDSRVKVIHQNNAGVSAARNAGLDKARGKWITFVDSDDWVEPCFLEKLLYIVMHNDCSIGICGFVGDKRYRPQKLHSYRVFEMLFSQNGYGGYSQKRIIRSDLINGDIVLRYNTNYRYMEDTEFFYRLFKTTDSVMFDNVPIYHYEDNDESVTHQLGFSEVHQNALFVFETMLSSEKDYRIHRSIEIGRLLFIFFGILIPCLMRNISCENYMYLRGEILKNIKIIWTSNMMTIRTKILIYLYLYFPKLVRNLICWVK